MSWRSMFLVCSARPTTLFTLQGDHMELRSASDASVKAKVAAYLLLNQEIADRKAQQENLKRELDPYLREADTNARGSHVIPFSEPLKVNGKEYGSLQRTKKV